MFVHYLATVLLATSGVFLSNKGHLRLSDSDLLPVNPVDDFGLLVTGTVYYIQLPQQQTGGVPAMLYVNLQMPCDSIAGSYAPLWAYGDDVFSYFKDKKEAMFIFERNPTTQGIEIRSLADGKKWNMVEDRIPGNNYIGIDGPCFNPNHTSQIGEWTLGLDPVNPKDGIYGIYRSMYGRNDVNGYHYTSLGLYTVNKEEKGRADWNNFIDMMTKDGEPQGTDGRIIITDQFQFNKSLASNPSAKIISFQYPSDIQDLLRNMSVAVDLAVEEDFENPSNASIKQTYSQSKTMTNTFSYGFSEGLKLMYSVTMEEGIPLIAEGKETVGGEIHLDSNQQWTSSSAETYSVSTEIDVPPWTGVKVISFVNWVPNIKIPYTTTLEITMQSMRVGTDYNTLVPTAAGADEVVGFLKNFAPDIKIVSAEGTKVVVEVFGEITGAMGLSTFIKTENVPVGQPDL